MIPQQYSIADGSLADSKPCPLLLPPQHYNLRDERDLSVATRLACGAFAGTFGQTVAYPFDVARRRLQVCARGGVGMVLIVLQYVSMAAVQAFWVDGQHGEGTRHCKPWKPLPKVHCDAFFRGGGLCRSRPVRIWVLDLGTFTFLRSAKYQPLCKLWSLCLCRKGELKTPQYRVADPIYVGSTLCASYAQSGTHQYMNTTMAGQSTMASNIFRGLSGVRVYRIDDNYCSL